MHKTILSSIIAAGLFTFAATCAHAAGDEADVEHAARAYRIRVYEVYRSNRQQYDQWRQFGDQLLHRWRISAKSPEQREAAAQWYRDALAGIESDVAPDLPEFATRDLTAPQTGSLTGSRSQPPADQTQIDDGFFDADAPVVDTFDALPNEESSFEGFTLPVLDRRTIESKPQTFEEMEEALDNAAAGDDDAELPSDAPAERNTESTSKRSVGGLLRTFQKAVLGGQSKSSPQSPAPAESFSRDNDNK